MSNLLPMRVTAGLALLSCALIVVTILRYSKLYQAIAYKLILYQNLALFFENFVICFFPQSNYVTCYLQAIVSEYAGVSSVFWACTISYALYKITSPHFYLAYSPENDFMKFCIFALCLPFLICLIPAFFDSYGQTEGGWCWVTEENSFGEVFVRIVTQIINWGCIFFIILTNFVIYYNIYSMKVTGSTIQNRQKTSSRFAIVRKLVLYPLILAICYFPISLPPAWLKSLASLDRFYLITSIILRTRGILNLIYFSSDNRVHKLYLQDLNTCFPFLNISTSSSSFSSDELKTQSPHGSPSSPRTDYQMNSTQRPSGVSFSGGTGDNESASVGEISTHEIGYVLRTTSTPLRNTGVVEV